MKTKTLIPFLAITFGLTWGLAAILFLFYDQIVAIFGEVSMTNPLFILAVYAPGIAGVLLVWRTYGFKGLGSFFRRLTLWRASKWWWLFLILGIPALVYAGAAIKGSINDPFPFSPWTQVFPAIVVALFLGPHRRVRLAWTGPTAVTAQALSILGWPDPGLYLGPLAYPLLPDRRVSPERLVIRALLHRYRRHLGHPDTPIQQCPWQPAYLCPVSLPDDEPCFP